MLKTNECTLADVENDEMMTLMKMMKLKLWILILIIVIVWVMLGV